MSSKRSVLIVSRSLPFHRAGGMEFVTWDLARALADSGPAVTMLTTRIPGSPATFMEDGVAVVALQESAPGRYSRNFWRASREWFRRNAPDVNAVLSVSAGAYGLLPDRAHRPETRFVMQAHGTSVGEIRSKLRTRTASQWLASVRNAAWLGRDLRAYSRFDCIVAVGPAVAEEFRVPILSRALPAEKVIVIENGIDTARFRPDPSSRSRVRESLGWDSDDLVVATVCRLHYQKGVMEALLGFVEHQRRRGPEGPRARWLVVGDGEARESVLVEASRLLPTENYHVFGEVERNEIPALLNAADVFLFPTLRSEGLPLNVLEAAATGLPLVLSRTLRQGLELPGPVLHVNPSDSREIADALDRLSSGTPRARDVKGVAALPERYTLGRCAARYVEVLFPDLET